MCTVELRGGEEQVQGNYGHFPLISVKTKPLKRLEVGAIWENHLIQPFFQEMGNLQPTRNNYICI